MLLGDGGAAGLGLSALGASDGFADLDEGAEAAVEQPDVIVVVGVVSESAGELERRFEQFVGLGEGEVGGCEIGRQRRGAHIVADAASEEGGTAANANLDVIGADVIVAVQIEA